MLAIIKSIRPHRVANILNGLQLIEIDKSAPKEWKDYLSGKTKKKPKPREVFVCCTKGKEQLFQDINKKWFVTNCFGEDGFNSRVLAKFTLNKVEEINPKDIYETFSTNPFDTQIYETCEWCKKSCLTFSELDNYLNGDKGYAWHIDNLVIFDKPKELSEFKRYTNDYDCKQCAFGKKCDLFPCDIRPLTRTPQNWCYCEV